MERYKPYWWDFSIIQPTPDSPTLILSSLCINMCFLPLVACSLDVAIIPNLLYRWRYRHYLRDIRSVTNPPAYSFWSLLKVLTMEENFNYNLQFHLTKLLCKQTVYYKAISYNLRLFDRAKDSLSHFTFIIYIDQLAMRLHYHEKSEAYRILDRSERF